jgi:hypothetical protein
VKPFSKEIPHLSPPAVKRMGKARMGFYFTRRLRPRNEFVKIEKAWQPGIIYNSACADLDIIVEKNILVEADQYFNPLKILSIIYNPRFAIDNFSEFE